MYLFKNQLMRSILLLRKLQLVGFKSFAEKTILTFESGITAIVGPNGCGKSNIADAFRWVFGEQSAKSMRGNKMPDVIFAGASGRPPLNFAEVSITLSEIQGALPIDYEEITVTRRLHRSGESEYFLNNQPTRLKDLNSLFMDGIGKVVEQGKIDQIINNSPLERRYIFEEAAGILRFLQRKRETMRKLEQVDGNVSRIKDIHSEVEKQVAILSEQAAKAKDFKELKGEIERQEMELLVGKARLAEKRKIEALAQAEEMAKFLANISEIIQSLEQQKKASKNELEEVEKKLKIQSEQLYQTKSEKTLKSREKISSQEQINTSLTKQKRWQQELETIFEQRQHRQQELIKLTKLLQASEADASTLVTSLQSQREQVLKLESEVNKLHQEHKKAQQELLSAHQRENHIDSEQKQNRVRLENCSERKQQLIDRKDRLQMLDQELIKQYEDREKKVKEGNETIEKQRGLLEALEVKVQEAVNEMAIQQAEHDKIIKELNEHQARLKALLRLRADFEGFSTASKRLLQESSNSQSPLFGTLKGLYECISPLEESALEAVASALGRYAETLVVETKADVDKVLTFANLHKLSDFSLIVVDELPQKNFIPAKSLEPLLSKIAPSRLARHFLNDIYLSDSIKEIDSLFDESFEGEIWYKDGLFVDRKGVYFYGIQAKNNAFLREAEIKALELEVQTFQIKKQDQENKIALLQQTKAQLHAEMVELDKSIRRREMEQVEATFALQRIGADREKNKKEFTNAETELSLLLEAMEKHQALLNELQKQLQDAHITTQNVKSRVSTLEADVLQKDSILKEQKKRLHDVDTSCHGAAEQVRQSKHAIQVIEIKENESIRQERRVEEELQLNSQFQEQLHHKIHECDKALGIIEANLQEMIAACNQTEQAIAQQKAYIADLEKIIADNLQNGKKQENEQHQISLLIAQLEAASQSIEEELRERHNLSLEEAKIQIPKIDKSIDSMEKRLRELRKRSEASGDINMTAIEECAKHQVRYEFLNKQIGDLEGSKEELLKIIKELETESRRLFKETFGLICSNFKKNFSILFNGGEADLQFTETSDLLEAGIEIIAKPPGKQMRSISLLSGGEKCLTAMALLFAIFEVKAGPFCILDEIDAPLDDSNVERFANMVKQFIDRSQFIIITHNKQTMAIADRLYGVSMQEKGISKLLQMELSQAEVAV